MRFAKPGNRVGESPDIGRPVLRRTFNAYELASQKAVSPIGPIPKVLLSLDRPESSGAFHNESHGLLLENRYLISLM
jgi:hypothetical protein